MDIKEHLERISPHDLVITPSHEKRNVSVEFQHAVKRLKEDGHYKCWVCGSIENLQVHHFGCEWSLQEYVDYDKLKIFLEDFDPYGYGKLLKNQPLTTVDDVRNMLVLCQPHHTGINHVAGNSTGIHYLVFPMWISQAMSKAGEDPVPQEGETIEKAEERIEEEEKKENIK